MLRHQLRQDLTLSLDLLLQVVDPFLLGCMVGPRFRLEGSRLVLEELLLPAVEDRGLESLLVMSHNSEIGTCSNRCRLRMATLSSGV
jgi:hypothetical protein